MEALRAAGDRGLTTEELCVLVYGPDVEDWPESAENCIHVAAHHLSKKRRLRAVRMHTRYFVGTGRRGSSSGVAA